MNAILVTDAKYIHAYKVSIEFSDKTTKIIDFEPFLIENPHPQWEKFIKIENFKKFKIFNGNIVWGRNWDLVFPIHSLYTGNLLEQCC